MVRRVYWRKRIGVGVAHAVRETQPKTLCGVTVRDDWTQQGAVLREGTRRCRRCRDALAGGI